MGCGCSNTPLTHQTIDSTKSLLKQSNLDLTKFPKKSFNDIYQTFSFKNQESALSPIHSNLLLFTFENSNTEFISLDWEKNEKFESSTFKGSYAPIAIGYNKGYKIDCLNQDKFFVIIDGEIEAYCVVDGHGPFGDIIAQIVQDKVFSHLIEMNSNTDNNKEIEVEYGSIFNNLFASIQKSLIDREVKNGIEYDPFLSGCALTILIKKRNWLYEANIGNVCAFVTHCDKLCPSKLFIDQLTLDDSNFSFDNNLLSNNPNTLSEKKESEVKNIHGDYNINEELRRIYESGGEIRKLAGEDVNRIFIKGKYFPGVINTRALGDQIGNGIGILNQPHIGKFHLKSNVSYNLVICTDGIGKVCSVEKMANIIQENDNRI